MKTRLPVAVTFIAGVIVLLEYFFKWEGLSTASTEIMNWAVIVAAFASVLGAANLVRIHSNKARRQTETAVYSWLLLATLFGYMLLGLVRGPQNQSYRYLYDNVLQPLSSTMWATNAFFIVSAAYRAMVARNREATLLLGAAVLVMLGRVGIGEAMWNQFAVISAWIMDIPNGAAMRGILIGSALGAVAMNLRILLGFERSHFSGSN